MTKYSFKKLWSTLLLFSLLTIPTQSFALPLCEGLVFSIEEDFISMGPKPDDGNPVISDGDLLVRFIPGPGVAVCARNGQLLSAFDVQVDLGLDAVDVILAKKFLIAFSTELDDERGRFTAGDLIATNGAVLPNNALLARFDTPKPQDFGLDAVHFVGEEKAITKILGVIKDQGRKFWVENPKALSEILNEMKVDIWFSTEGTAFSPNLPFLDGDLLSARTGSIVARNSILLPVTVPAGVPNRGVDFGLDAASTDRKGNRRLIHFSTEILFEGKPGFTDGDVIRLGNGVVVKHPSLVIPLEPAARFLGLDALHFVTSGPPRDPNLQTMCGDRALVDFNGGLAPINGPGTGLYRANSAMSPPGDLPPRPCGEYVPADGFLPDTGVNRFRVSYRADGVVFPGTGIADGIRTRWTLYEWNPVLMACLATGSLSTDASGWMNAADYLAAKDGTLTGCTNSGMRLAVWDTNDRQGFGWSPPDKNGHYVLWLEWEDSGSTLHREPFEHHLQLDNTLPKIAAFPNGLKVLTSDGVTPVPACGEAPEGISEFQVHGQFSDKYYWYFKLRLRGGLPPASVLYGPHNYYDPHDGTPPIKNTDDTGTTPDLTTVHLRNIFMTDLGKSFQDCCYVLDLWVRDAAIRHSFNGRVANDNSGSSAWLANAFVTFAASP